MEHNIAIIGMSYVYPHIRSAKDYLKILREGKFVSRDGWKKRGSLMNVPEYDRLVGKTPLLDGIEFFDNRFFGIIKKEALDMTPEMKLALVHSIGSIYDAGYSVESVRGKDCGAVIASSSTAADYRRLTSSGNSAAYLNTRESMIGEKLSYYFELTGPVFAVDSTCSSSLLAVAQACDILESNQADMMIAGGVQLYLPFDTERAHELLLGNEAFSGEYVPFEKKASGLCVGEGAGFVLLKRYDDAMKDKDHIYGVITGTGISGSRRADRVSPYAPDGTSQSIAIKRAWEKAGINADVITEIEAHGSATDLGDAEEIKGLSLAFADRHNPDKVLLSCVKSNIGHTSQCAGVSGLIKVLIGFENNEAYPIAHFNEPKTDIGLELSHVEPLGRVVKFSESTKRIAGIAGYGLNSLNVHIVVENHLEKKSGNTVPDKTNRILRISGRTEKSFAGNAKAIAEYLQGTNADINDVIYTLNIGRDDFKYSSAVYFESKESLIEQLANISPIVNETYETDPFVSIASPIGDISDTVKTQLSEANGNKAKIVCILINSGFKVDFNEYYSNSEYHRVSVVPYQFDKVYNWPIEPKQFEEYAANEESRAFSKYVDEAEVKAKILMIWRELLETEEEIDENASFFELGGNSMLASILIDSVNTTFGSEMELMDIYSYNTIAEICNFVIDARSKTDTANEETESSLGTPEEIADIEKTDNIQICDEKNPEETTPKSSELSEDEVRSRLTDLWKEVLESEENINENETFFELGGNSMLASILIDSINTAFGCEMELMDIYSYNTISEMIKFIKGNTDNDKKV